MLAATEAGVEVLRRTRAVALHDFDVALADWSDDERQVELEALQALHERRGGVHDELEAHLGVLAPEAAHGVRERIEARRVDHAHRQAAGAALAVGLYPFAELGRPAEHLGREPRRLPADLGELATTTPRLEKREADPTLELGEGLRERRLGDVESPRGLGERAGAFHLPEVDELLEVDAERCRVVRRDVVHKRYQCIA